MIKCAICDKELKQITRNHLINHKITVKEYKEKFPDQPLQDESIIMKGERNPFYGKSHLPETIDAIRKKAKSRPVNPEIGKQISEKWKDPNGNYRKMMLSEEYRLKMKTVMKNWWSLAPDDMKRDRFRKMQETNIQNNRWISPEDKDPFILYRDEVRKLTNENYNKHFKEIENAHLRGKGYELDHIVSIYEGFINCIPEEIIACLSNIRVIPSIENKRKSRKSHMSCEQLINEYENQEMKN